jgi:osmotically-inducible protein OsmY
MRAGRLLGAVVAAGAVALASGCGTTPRGIESIGGYVDDSAITSKVKTRLVEDPSVDARAIVVETANGNVTLSGVARTSVEKATAESIAIKVRGVKTLQNHIVVRP